MMKIFLFIFIGTAASYCQYFGLWNNVFGYAKSIAQRLDHQEVVEPSLRLAELESQVVDLKFEIAKLKTENEILVKESHQIQSRRAIASVEENDLVQFEIYQWKEIQLWQMGQKNFDEKNYEKASQFYLSLIKNYPESNKIDDLFYFNQGVSLFYSKKLNEAKESFQFILTNYKTSDYFVKSKVWLGLVAFYEKDISTFKISVSELRDKYRNTEEWKMLSKYYGNLAEKYDW